MSEISSACERRLINCSKHWFDFMPPSTGQQWDRVGDLISKSFEFITYGGDIYLARTSSGTENELNAMKSFLRLANISPGADKIFVNGWVDSGSANWIFVTCYSENGVSKLIPKRSSNADSFKSGRDRFSFTVQNSDNCSININDANSTHAININQNIGKTGPYHLNGNYTVNIDQINPVQSNNISSRFLFLKKALIALYSKFAIVLDVAGLISFALLLVIGSIGINKINSEFKYVVTLCAGLLLAVSSRVAILVAVEVTSFPTMYTHYFGPAIPMLTLFSSIAVVWLFSNPREFCSLRRESLAARK